MEDTKPLSYAELLKLRKPLRNVNTEIKQKLSVLDKVALWITQKVGSMGFFLLIFTWTLLWLGWNTFGAKRRAVRPVPCICIVGCSCPM